MKAVSERTVLLFEELLPKQQAGDIAPCRAVLRTKGVRAGEPLSVVLMDRGVALQAAVSGGWAKDELDRALALSPDEIGLDDRTDAKSLATLLGDPRLSSEQPIRIDDYAELTSALLSNGLLLSERASALCVRPGIVNPSELDADELRRALDRHLHQTRGLPPDRALALSLVGTSWLSDRSRRDVVAGAVANRGFSVKSVCLGAGTAVSCLSALRFLVELALRVPGKPAELGLGDDVDPSIADLRQELVGALTLDTLERVDERWRREPTAKEREALLRRSDDAVRRACFSAITASRAQGGGRQESSAVDATTERLGPPQSWIRSYRQASRSWRPRIVVIPTWQCELRCRYCRIPKQDGRVMPLCTVDRALDLLLSSDADELDLHFFGGEPLAAWEVIQHTLSTGHARARAEGRSIRFLFTTNGWALSRERFDWLARFPVWYQLSLDGDRATQNAARPALRVAGDSYERSPATKASWFREAGIENDVVQVVHPSNVDSMAGNFRHILELDYSRIQINYALGTFWERPAMEEFGRQLAIIGEELETRWENNQRAELVNLEETLLPVRGNLEVTIDWDGGVFGTTAFLVNTKHREDFRLGHLDDARSFDRYQHDGFEMDHLLSNWFSPEMADNNRLVGSVLMSFIRHMKRKHPERELRGSGPSDRLKPSRVDQL